MSPQPSESEKAAILAHILQSPGFQESKRHQELLQYLVERSASASSLKETEIAQDVFGKDSKFDPSTDPLIRSYISNLRKKLEHYYLTADPQFGYRLEIPKGHYIVKYIKLEPKQKPQKLGVYLPSIQWGIILVLSILVIVLAVREFDRRTPGAAAVQQTTANPIWNEFVQANGRPTLIVLGDFFFLRERSKNADGYYRTIKINNLDEYLEYISKDPDFGKKYTKNNFTYLRPSAPWGVMQLLPLFQNSSNGITLKLASQFSSDDFKSNNIIFIGSFKTLYLLKSFLNTFRLEHFSSPSSFRIRDGISDSTYVFTPEKLAAGSLEKDFGVVAKGRGPDGSCIMMLLGFSESGVIQATHAVSDPKLLATIAEKFPPGRSIDPSSFTLVIGANGITQSLFEADIKYVSGLGVPQDAGAAQHDTARQGAQ
jgi:hypothetical protein